jgi:hypothetical protein
VQLDGDRCIRNDRGCAIGHGVGLGSEVHRGREAVALNGHGAGHEVQLVDLPGGDWCGGCAVRDTRRIFGRGEMEGGRR